MSRTTRAINLIKEDLDSVSGLDGIVGDMMDILQKDIHNRIQFVKNNFPEANLFDYYGLPKSREDNEKYQCQHCGKFITNEEGITCEGGEWVCDNDSCRTLNDEADEAFIKDK